MAPSPALCSRAWSCGCGLSITASCVLSSDGCHFSRAPPRSRPLVASAAARRAGLCVGHVRQFGGESPLCNLMEVKH